MLGARARDVAVSSIKSMVGHCLGAAGAIEAVALVLTIERRGSFPRPWARSVRPGRPLEARIISVRAALSNSFAFGGNNGAIVVGRVDA